MVWSLFFSLPRILAQFLYSKRPIREIVQAENSNDGDGIHPFSDEANQATEHDPQETATSEMSTCPICLHTFDATSKACCSPNPLCNHIFHQHCILEWLIYHSECPCCREDFLDATGGVKVINDGNEAVAVENATGAHPVPQDTLLIPLDSGPDAGTRTGQSPREETMERAETVEAELNEQQRSNTITSRLRQWRALATQRLSTQS